MRVAKSASLSGGVFAVSTSASNCLERRVPEIT